MQQQLRQDAPKGPHVHLWAARLLPQDLQLQFTVRGGGGEEPVTAVTSTLHCIILTHHHEERV